ncbi:hypothetical protein Tco_0356786 [Tanacetum coccineum]
MATCHHLSGATWHFHCSPPPLVNRRSTAAGPPVNDGQHRRTTGQRRRSTTVNGGGPPLTTAGPPVNHRSIVVDGMSTAEPGQLKSNSIKDTKKLLEAVEKRFGVNATTRKTQRNLLKQQYENFTAPSSEMLDQIFDKLQKLVS